MAKFKFKDFANVLTTPNRIETPANLEEITGYNPRAYLVEGYVFMHFDKIHTDDESSRVLEKIMGMDGEETLAGIWGDEFVAAVPSATFQKLFPKAWPA